MLIKNIINKLINNGNIVATSEEVINRNLVFIEGLQAEEKRDGDCRKGEGGVVRDGEDER